MIAPARYPYRFLEFSNAMTYVSLGAAVFAMLAAMHLGDRNLTGALIAVSVFADLLDGRFARLFKRDKDSQLFGAQIDSLVDLVAFGVAPVVCMDRLSAFETFSLVWAASALFYLLSAATRLGFYNLFSAESGSFLGLPTTLAGLGWVMVLLFQPGVGVSSFSFLFLGALMVSPLKIPRPSTVVLSMIAGASVALMVAHLIRFFKSGFHG